MPLPLRIERDALADMAAVKWFMHGICITKSLLCLIREIPTDRWPCTEIQKDCMHEKSKVGEPRVQSSGKQKGYIFASAVNAIKQEVATLPPHG